MAKSLAKQDLAGWLAPEGYFIECIETGGTIPGLSLGRHEATALRILDGLPDLMRELVVRRNLLGCRTWPETTRHNLIKDFMRAHGYLRVAPDILDLKDFD
jgi:hypothetical protein